jgi:pimeloyl-ACP methyl ester carboxylesterase
VSAVGGPVTLHVAIDEGSGPPLVLLHGWPQDSTMWRHVVPQLSERFRCLALDLRGLGRSPAPPGGYDKPQFAADVLHTLDGLGIERFSVIGHDWGGITAQLLCVDAPERVEKAIVLDVPSIWQRPSDPRQLVGFTHVPILASPLGGHIAPTLAGQLMRMSGVPAEDVEHYVEMLSEPGRRHVTTQYYRRALLEDMPRMARGRERRPDVPMLFLGGQSSPITRWGTDFELIKGAGHFVVDNKPDEVVSRALAFL